MSESQIQNGDQSELKNKILKQVEYYFSDSNLPYDKFLFTLTTKNTGRWVPIGTLANFQKMKLLSQDIDLITAALKESEELLEVSEDGLSIRRKTDLVPPEALRERTIYAKGFPAGTEADKKEYFELQEEIQQFFSEFGVVNSVRMRNTDEKPHKFKGSVFVEYANLEDAKNAAEQQLKYKDTDLLIMTKDAYIAMKAEEYKDKAPTGGRKPKRFNAFSLNASSAFPKVSSYASPENKLLKYTIEKEGTTIDGIKSAIGQDKVQFVHMVEDRYYIELKESNAPELAETINSDETMPIKVSLPDSEESTSYYKEKKQRQSNQKGGRGGKGGNFGKKRKGGDNPNRSAVKARKTEA